MLNLFVIIPSIVFTIFATAVLSYVSMATMIGPWIAPAIVLLTSLVFKLRRIPKNRSETNKEMALIQTVGSVGGILGVGVGFSLPTLYFLDPDAFNALIQFPVYFCTLIAVVCFAAGGFGIWLARCFADKFVEEERLEFPVSQMIYKMISSQSQEKQANSMMFGLGASGLICFLRDGVFRIQGILHKVYYIFPRFFGKEMVFAITPMLWAIGFIVGGGIVFPLLVGMFSKYFILYPLNNHANYLPFYLFSPFKYYDFVTAFCSGLVLSELIMGLLKYPKIILKKIKSFSGYDFFEKTKDLNGVYRNKLKTNSKFLINLEPVLTILGCIIILSYFKFSFFAQAFLLIAIVLFTYQISYLGGKIGLITFGRFATFIMIPMMLLFKLDFMQITFLCVFFNVCAGVASDLLFDYKVAQLCDLSFKKVHRYQWFGLVITSLCIGFFLWLLFTTFQVGSADLFAQRGKSRALLIQSLNFDFTVLFLGFLFGYILKKLKISPTMVFGGILMPNSLTIGLVVGALISWYTKKSEKYFPLWSGVFAGESIWILVSILLRLF